MGKKQDWKSYLENLSKKKKIKRYKVLPWQYRDILDLIIERGDNKKKEIPKSRF